MLKFEKYLKDHGLKITPQRLAILQEIQRIGHATIEEIYESISKTYPSISLATIYKNIVSLCEINLLKEVKVNMQKQRYEINFDDHAHIVCMNCGRLEDLKLDSQSILTDKKIPKDFEVSHTAITIYGRCKKCCTEAKIAKENIE